jgi:hypothetical protein
LIINQKDSNDLIYEEEDLSYEQDIEKRIERSRVNFRTLEDIDEEAKNKGTILYRYFFVPVNNSRAFYQVIAVDGDKAVIKRCKGLCVEEHSDQYFGEKAVVNLVWVAMQIQALDKIRNIFPGINAKFQ